VPIYVELIRFKRGSFLKREDPFFTKKAFAVYDKSIIKFQESGEEALICIRNDNHTLVKSWTNVKPKPDGKEIIKAAKR